MLERHRENSKGWVGAKIAPFIPFPHEVVGGFKHIWDATACTSHHCTNIHPLHSA